MKLNLILYFLFSVDTTVNKNHVIFISTLAINFFFHFHLEHSHNNFTDQQTGRTCKIIYKIIVFFRGHWRAEFVKKSNELKSSSVESWGEEDLVIDVHKKKAV